MKTKENKIRAYDDIMLKNEHKLRTGNICLLVLFVVYAFRYMCLVIDGKSISEGLLISGVFLLLAHINANHQKHIESIKLYRKEIEKSQPEN